MEVLAWPEEVAHPSNQTLCVTRVSKRGKKFFFDILLGNIEKRLLTQSKEHFLNKRNTRLNELHNNFSFARLLFWAFDN